MIKVLISDKLAQEGIDLLKSMGGKFELIKMQVPEYMPPKEIAK